MSQALIDNLRRAREFQVTAGGHAFTLRRPTDAEAIALGGSTPIDLVRRFVVGWNLAEMDVIPGGGPEPAAFSSDLWAMWVDDRPDLWGVLSEAVFGAYKSHTEAREDAAKN